MSADESRVVVIIPALNEAGNVGAVVTQLLEGPADLVIVVDNGSTDETGSEAVASGATVVSEPRRGYGFACAAGVVEAARHAADVLVFIDADHSSDPAQVPTLLEPLRAGRADLVLGSRTLGSISPGAMPPHQRFGNWLSAKLMHLLYRVEVTDLGPFRAIRADLLVHLEMGEMTFGWPTEMTVKAANAKAMIVEVPVDWASRNAGTSKVSGTLKGSVLAAWHIIGVTIRQARGRKRTSRYERRSG